jgi:hypothetical protein
VIVVLATLLVASACSNGPPSPVECIARWNHPGNRESRAALAEMRFPRAHVDGWTGEGGDHCFATFFSRRGEPWVTFVFWLDAPEPWARFTRDVDGSRYGRGELGAPSPMPPNAEVEKDGTLNEQ